MRKSRENGLFLNVPDEQWNDWKWQIANRVTDVATLRKIINITDEEAAKIEQSLNKLRMAITPYYASLMDPDDPTCPVRMQAVPTMAETHIAGADIHGEVEPADGAVEGGGAAVGYV